MPYARISRKIRPIARMAAICRPTPRRGASSVVDSRSGAPEPRAVTGSLLRSVKVPPSIAEGPEGTPPSIPAARNPVSWLVGFGLVLAALVLYWVSNPEHHNFYNHFVWQADAFLHGRAWFLYPVPAGSDLPQNWYFQDVYPLTLPDGTPDGRVLLPFPPLPALVLLPFVAAWGLATDQEAVAVGLGVAGVALAWWMLGGLRLRTTVRALVTTVVRHGHGLVVGDVGRQHLVPGPSRRRRHRAGRRGRRAPQRPMGRDRARRGRGARAAGEVAPTPAEVRAAPGRSRRNPSRSGRPGPPARGSPACAPPPGRWTARRSSSGSCSASPSRRGCR